MKHLLAASIVLLSVFINSAFSQESQIPFNYKKTIWIIHTFEDGQVVYGMTSYYEPELAFISVRNILTSYVYVLENFPPPTSIDDLTPEYILVLMNDVTNQSLFIGDHWISDGKKIAVMQEPDFKRLKTILDHRKNTERSPKQQYSTESLIDSFRKDIENNPKESEYKLKIFEEGEALQLEKAVHNTSIVTSETKTISSSANSSISVNKTEPSDNRHQSVATLASTAPSDKMAKDATDGDEKGEFVFLKWGTGLFFIAIIVIWQFKRRKNHITSAQ